MDAIHPGYGFLSENPEFARGLRRGRHRLHRPAARDHARCSATRSRRAEARGRGRRAGDAGDRGRCRRTSPSARALAARHRLPGDAQGELGRRRPRHARGGERRRSSPRCCRWRGARRTPPSATTRSTSRSWCGARATSRCRSSATRTATSCTCTSATAPCSGATRRWSSARRRCSSARRSARSCARRRSRSAAPRTTCNAGTVEFLQDADSGQLLLHRGQSAHPGRAHGHRVRHRHRPGEGADPHRRRRAHRHRRERRAAAGARSASPPTRCSAASPPRIRRTTSFPTTARSPPTAARPASASASMPAPPTRGAIITRSYDSLLVKVTAWSPTPEETIARMHRALWEFRIRGVVTNLRFLDQLITHPRFARGDYTTRFIDETPELFRWPRKRDRATRILTYIGATIVNGNAADASGRPRPAHCAPPLLPALAAAAARAGHASRSSTSSDRSASRSGCSSEQRVLLTDTTMRDAHQSLLATRLRTLDMVGDRAVLRRASLPQLFSVECWGGATFDVAHALPARGPVGAPGAAARAHAEPAAADAAALGATRSATPTIPTTWCASSSQRAAAAGIDVFRIFDSLNWVENMRVAIDAVLESGKLCEAAICYTRQPERPAREQVHARLLPEAGARAQGRRHARARHQGHGGLCRPRAAYTLVKALKEEIGLPVHFHTHDTSGIGAASVLAAVEAGADAVDGAIDAMSGLTSQPNLGSIVEALRYGPRDSGIDPDAAARSSPPTGSRCAGCTPPSRATSAPAPRRSTCTACPAASTPTCASRRARSVSTRRAGPRSRAPTPRSTRCSATSSR